MIKPEKTQGRILVVDDEKNITLVMKAMLERAGYEVIVINDSQEALSIIDEEEFDTVITDLYMPGPSGMDILEKVKRIIPQLPVVMVTAYGTVESAVSALKTGAFDFVTKPFDQADLLSVTSKAVSTFRQRQKEPVFLSAAHALGFGYDSSFVGQQDKNIEPGKVPSGEIRNDLMIGSSPVMQEIFKVITKIASSQSTVLISGESGTGKELVALEVHRHSSRAQKSFIKINCAAIPATLIESELFGYEKGAFTGAVSSKPGRFELAHEGTLFLDEVGEMPLEMQVKLLRILQEQEFERVGGVQTIKVDVRIITATNRNLAEEVKAGKFREDLFYRLNVMPISLPPLRERQEDIEKLTMTFLAQLNLKLGRKILGVDPKVLRVFKEYAWPGNIRQLENTVERMVLMCEEPVLRIEDMPIEILEQLPKHVLSDLESEEWLLQVGASGSKEGATPYSFKALVKKRTQNVEKDLIEKALEETGGNVTKAAERLGLSRKGLQLKMKELGLRREGI